jgi:hypothetical protein
MSEHGTIEGNKTQWQECQNTRLKSEERSNVMVSKLERTNTSESSYIVSLKLLMVTESSYVYYLFVESKSSKVRMTTIFFSRWLLYLLNQIFSNKFNLFVVVLLLLFHISLLKNVYNLIIQFWEKWNIKWFEFGQKVFFYSSVK